MVDPAHMPHLCTVPVTAGSTVSLQLDLYSGGLITLFYGGTGTALQKDAVVAASMLIMRLS